MTMPVEVLRKVEEGIRLEAETAEPGDDHPEIGAEARSLLERARRLYARIKRLLGTREDAPGSVTRCRSK